MSLDTYIHEVTVRQIGDQLIEALLENPQQKRAGFGTSPKWARDIGRYIEGQGYGVQFEPRTIHGREMLLIHISREEEA